MENKYTPELIATSQFKFSIPLYQRLFAWKKKEVTKLLFDLKEHFAKMPEVLTFFIDKALEEKKVGIAYVTTPMEVTDAQKKQIEDRLLETTAYQSFRMHYAVDADLIGGMVIRIGDRVVDSSVRTKISELSRELSKIQLKVGESAS